jgi:MoaA/NifB/PqqE/SkfB family radical SAM enzyme
LGTALVAGAIEDAARLGFTVVSFSGGEPVLYKPLAAMLQHAKQCGLRTTMTTNGMLLTPTVLNRLRSHLDLLAISLDGAPASHDEMRDHPNAFSTMARRLPMVRESGIPFGLIFTLTMHNVHELDWAAQFAVEQGASLLQIHPLEAVGRALVTLDGSAPDSVESTFALLEVLRIQEKYDEQLRLQLDLVLRPSMEEDPSRVFADECPIDGSAPFAELVSPLILETDGTVSPLEYGFARAFALGNIHQARLADLAPHWRANVYPHFRKLCRHVYNELAAPSNPPIFNWYEAVATAAEQSSLATPA